MNARQRDVVTLTCLTLAAVLFVAFFFVDLVRWAAWKPGHDLLSQILAVRPRFPNDARSVVLGLVLPVLLVGAGLFLRSGADRT
ncbi:MAG TPA: hypothetical protein VMS88_07830 [Terriglobales bacterium]|nr:hypothetical protein [Terriglobales bacterium]